MNRTLSAGRVRSDRRASVQRSVARECSCDARDRRGGRARDRGEQTWRTALFGAVIAAAIAATRVRFALHAAAVLLVVLAVLAAAGAGRRRRQSDAPTLAARPAMARHGPPGPAAGRLRSTRASKRHPRAGAR